MLKGPPGASEIMLEIVATDIVASRLAKSQPNGTPTARARANFDLLGEIEYIL